MRRILIIATLAALAGCNTVCPYMPSSVDVPGCPTHAPTPMPTADLNYPHHQGG